MNIYILFVCIIVFIVFVLVYNHIIKNNKCDSGYQCQNGVCVSLTPTSITPIMGSESPSCVPDINPIPTSLIPGSNPIPTSPIPNTIPDISNQPNNTIQIINNTSENPLHVFLSTGNTEWVKQDGNGYTFPSINWGGGDKNLLAWDPVGAGLLTEIVIPLSGNIILQIPEKLIFRVSPLKLRNNDYTNITSFDIARSKVLTQWPILIEGGKDVVADSSSVDGINFKMKYELTVVDPINSYKVVTATVNQNPCAGLGSGYQLEVGCRNPAKIDCNNKPSCDCCPSTQKCRFNSCSQILFNIPDNLTRYIGYYDIGDKNSCNDCPANCPNVGEKVKPFINQSNNLKKNSPLKLFCDALQKNTGDFTSYCYDYNDTTSSPTLADPYKMRITYMDL